MQQAETFRAGSTERLLWSGFALVLIAVIVAGAWSLLERRSRFGGGEQLPVLGVVPEFQLVERSGALVRRGDLEGRIWIADFVFTHCSGICPVLSSRMAALQKEIEQSDSEARLVSFSVDPTRDTPDVLKAYADRYGADSSRWLFLTGERRELHRLIGDGFRLSVAERSPEEAGDSSELITHSDRFVLVDRAARIRGYYRMTEEGSARQLLLDIEKLESARSS